MSGPYREAAIVPLRAVEASEPASMLAILAAAVNSSLDPVTPEETTAAYAEAYAAIERDLRETVAASSASFGPAARAALLGDEP